MTYTASHNNRPVTYWCPGKDGPHQSLVAVPRDRPQPWERVWCGDCKQWMHTTPPENFAEGPLPPAA